MSRDFRARRLAGVLLALGECGLLAADAALEQLDVAPAAAQIGFQQGLRCVFCRLVCAAGAVDLALAGFQRGV